MPDAELRASDVEREALVGELRHHAGEGRLDVEELSERIDAAYSAKTRGELAALVRDLPHDAPGAGRGGAEAGPPQSLAPAYAGGPPGGPGRRRFSARWRAPVGPEAASAELLRHVAPPLYEYGYDLVDRSSDRLVFTIERRPLWPWFLFPFTGGVSLVGLLIKKTYTIRIDLVRAGDETLLVAQGVAPREVRRAFHRLNEGA